MDQPNIVIVLCDTLRYMVKDGAREIAEAIRSGKLDPSDPRG